MGINDFFRPERIKRKWTYEAQGSIWRIFFSEDGFIVGEDRDSEAKTVSYFCLDECTGKAIWLGKKFGKEWWSGIEAVAGDVVCIHSFENPQMPDHKGIIAVDLRSGQQRWENPELRFLSAADGIVLAVQDAFEGRSLFRLKLSTGEVIDRSGPEAAVHDVPGPHIDERRFRFPEILTQECGDVYAAVSRHLRPEDLAGNVEFIHADEVVLFNYHEKNAHSTPQQTALNNVFSIVSLANEHILFSEILNTDVSYPVPDSFFIHADILYYIKDRSILTAVQV